MVLPFFILQMTGCGGGGGGGGGDSQPARTLVSITVTSANSNIAAGGSSAFSAKGAYSDNSTADLTTTVRWSSSMPAVATVSNATGSQGTVTGLAGGTSGIIAMIGAISGSANATVTGGTTASTNVMLVTVNGSLCSDSRYFNKPCVAVTICDPGTSTCRTVPDILLDTGSFGLRVFKEAITGLALTPVASGPGSLAECVQFADGSSLWGSVQRAGVQMGNEPLIQIPIQVIDAAFAARPPTCSDADPDRIVAGFNGILGVGISPEDCGPACASSAGIGIYYSCTNGNCSGTTVTLANQVQNPVAHLPLDNNGVRVQLPAVPLGGLPSLDGTLTFGIGTQANNVPASPTVLPTNQFGTFRTVYNAVNVTSFLDTGSNGIFFPNENPPLPVCPPPNSDWYCPPVTRALFATMIGAFGTPSVTEQFEIGNLVTLAGSPNNVFRELGGRSTFGFDWGLPFFMGRTVYMGIEGRASTLGTGPYVAF